MRQTKSCMAILLAFFTIAGVAPIAEAQSLFRLFSTPAERAELERQRQRLFRPGQLPVVSEPQPILEMPEVFEPEPEAIIYRLGGAMARSDGMYTIWLNGAAIDQENLPDNIELLQPFDQGRLLISNPENGNNYEVKPGQVLNLTTGELFESYEYSDSLLQDVELITDSVAESASLMPPESPTQ